MGNDKLWRNFCKVIDRIDWIENEDFINNEKRNYNHSILKLALDKILKEKSVTEWMQIFNDANIPASPINDISSVANDEQVTSRNMLVDVEQPGVGTVKVAGNPIKLSNVSSNDEISKNPAPAIGEHTSEVLKEYLGFSDEEIQEYLVKMEKS